MTNRNKNGIRKNRFNIFIWTLFDFGNTSFSIVVVTFLYAVYFKQTVAQNSHSGDLYWSWAIAASMLITALIAPVLGAIADYSAGKKRFLLFFTLVSVISTSMLYFAGPGDIFYGMLFFITANIGFEAGLVFYDAFLPELTSPKNFGRVSGYGFAMGYLGSLATLAIAYPFIQAGMIKETFPFSALFFLVFALPLFIFLKDNRKNIKTEQSFIRIGINRVIFTVKHLKNFKNLSIFLFSYFLFIEGVNTVIFFSGNYASTTLNFSMQELIIFFIIVQTTAILGSVLFGLLSDKVGQKKTIQISLYIWIFNILLAFLSSKGDWFLIQSLVSYTDMSVSELERYLFYVVGLLSGSVMGATQSTSRSLMSKLTPEDKKTEFFGFFSLFGKSSAIMGPVVFGLTSYIFRDQTYAILSILIFFVAGLLVLGKVKET